MLTISPNQAFPIREVLFTFALDAEAADVFQDHNHLICGIGKVSATYHLLKAIQEKKPALIVNLGSAGSNHFQRGEMVCCTQFIQRDMNVTGLGYISDGADGNAAADWSVQVHQAAVAFGEVLNLS